MKKMNNKGFSLVELIIVIAIMAILVGVLAPQFIKYVEQSRQSADIDSIDEVKKAVETFVADYNPGGSVTVTASGTAKTIVADGGDTVNFSTKEGDYGIDHTKQVLKSTKSSCVWTYNCDTFVWSATTMPATTTAGLYYDYESGEKI